MRPWKPRRALTHNLLVMPLNNCGNKAVRLGEQPAKREQLCGLGEVGCSLRRVASSALSPCGKRGHAQRPALLATGLQSCRSSPLCRCDPVWHPCCTESAAECVCVFPLFGSVSAIAVAHSTMVLGCLAICPILVKKEKKPQRSFF